MNSKNQVKTSLFEPLKRAVLGVFTLISRLFGVEETLFFVGLGGFFYGISQIVSFPAAVAACGVLLMLLAVAMLFYRNGAPPKGES